MDITQAREILGEPFSFVAGDLQLVIEELNLPKTARILDVGTGMGSMAIALALNGYRVLTGEPGDDESAYGKQNWRDQAEKVRVDGLIEFEPFNAAALPYDDGAFDAVFLLGALHHIEEGERPEVFRELARIGKPGAVICFFEPNRQLIDKIRVEDPAHPDPADPDRYAEGIDLTSRKIAGSKFDVFVYRKQT